MSLKVAGYYTGYQALFSLYSDLAKHALSANIGAVYINFVFCNIATVYDVWSMK